MSEPRLLEELDAWIAMAGDSSTQVLHRVHDKILGLQSDVESYRRVSVRAIAEAQNIAVASARNKALEDAAQVCIGMTSECGVWPAATMLRNCAAAIRALKERSDE